MRTYGRTLLYYAFLLFISPLMANDKNSGATRKVIESPLYDSDNNLKKTVVIHPALVYGEADFHLKPNDNDPLFTTYEFVIPTISLNQSVQMRRVFILLPRWDLRRIDEGFMVSAKGKKIPYPTGSLMFNSFSQYLRPWSYVNVLVEERHSVPKYIAYRCQKPSMPFSEKSALDCTLNGQITVSKNLLTAQKPTAPYHLLETIIYAAYTQTRNTTRSPNGIINKDITVNFNAYHKPVTEAEYNIQTEAIYTAASKYSDSIENAEWISTQLQIEQAQKELDRQKKALNECNEKNLDHQITTDELINERDTLRQKVREL